MQVPNSRHALIQQFQFKQPVAYHSDSLKRLQFLQGEHLRKAAVLIGFVERAQGLHVLFTKRARHLKHHPGQISFPGGKLESYDSTLQATALRETHEEIGISPHLIEIFGQMPELPTISAFNVTPYLAFIDSSYTLNIDYGEVDDVFEVPVDIVLDPRFLNSMTFDINQQSHRVFGINYQNHFIWGMTAQIIQAMQSQIVQI